MFAEFRPFWIPKHQDTTPLGRILNRFSQDIALMDLQMPRIFEFAMQHLTVVAVGIFGASVFLVKQLIGCWRCAALFNTRCVMRHAKSLKFQESSLPLPENLGLAGQVYIFIQEAVTRGGIAVPMAYPLGG